MALKRGGLGRGLDSLIPDKKKEQTAKKTGSSKDDVKPAKAVKKKKKRNRRERVSRDTDSTPSSRAARVSVRRQRH